MLLNPDKSEALLVARKSVSHGLSKVCAVNVAESNIKFQSKFKSLGVTLDSNLSFSQHVQEVARVCTFHIRAFRHIRNYPDSETAKTVARSIVSSRLDYCNTFLYNRSQANLEKLQRVQNNIAHATVRARRTLHITPILRVLHWLSIRQRITFKVALLTHRAYYGSAPCYLSAAVNKYHPARELRSANQHQLVEPTGISGSLGSQSFSAVAARV